MVFALHKDGMTLTRMILMHHRLPTSKPPVVPDIHHLIEGPNGEDTKVIKRRGTDTGSQTRIRTTRFNPIVMALTGKTPKTALLCELAL